MWPTIERWSWLAGIVGALIGVVTLLQARRDRRQAQQDWRTQINLQAALLEAMQGLTGEVNPTSSPSEAQAKTSRTQEAPAALKQRAESFARSAKKLEKRAQRRLRVGSALLGFALFAGAVAVFIRPSTIDEPISFVLSNTLTFAAHIGLPVTARSVVGIIILGVVFGIITAPLQVHNIRDNRLITIYDPLIRRIQKRFKDDHQRQAEEMQYLQREAGFSPLARGLRGFVIAIMTFVSLWQIPRPQPPLTLFGAPLVTITTGGFIAGFLDGLPATVPLAALITLARVTIHRRMEAKGGSKRITMNILIGSVVAACVLAGGVSPLLAIIGYHLIAVPLVAVYTRKPIALQGELVEKWSKDNQQASPPGRKPTGRRPG